MQLRIYRTFRWENTSDMIGGPPKFSLMSTDTLQYMNDEGEWVDVPVVEEEAPDHPGFGFSGFFK